MFSASRKRNLAAIVAATAGFGLTSAAHASSFVWNAATGNWDVGTNWTPSGPPTSADRAVFGGATPASVTVDLTQTETAGALQVVDRAVQFDLNTFTLNFAGNDLASHNSIDAHWFEGDDGHATFNGPGDVNFTGRVAAGYGSTPGRAQITAQGGANVTTNTGLQIGAYRGSGTVTVQGDGTVWDSHNVLQLGLSGGDPAPPQPRARLRVLDGGVFNHHLGGYPSSDLNSVNWANAAGQNAEVTVDGEGSQLNFVGDYTGNMRLGGSSSSLTVDVTNGGLFSSGGNLPLSFANGTGVNTYNINGEGSKMTAPTMGLGTHAPNSGVVSGPTVINVGVGGTLETTSDDESNRSIAIADRGRVSLQGGTIALDPTAIWGGRTQVILQDKGVVGQNGTLEGFGTITGGDVVVQGESTLRPGLAAATGTITLQDGNVDVQSTSAVLDFEINTDTGAHDRIQSVASGSDITVDGFIDYANLGSTATDFGIMDILIADTIAYNATLGGGNFTSGDLPGSIGDDLDETMLAAGYTTRVFDTPDAPGEYRYYIATDVIGSLDALRVETQPIPEPTALGLLGLGGLLAMRRRR